MAESNYSSFGTSQSNNENGDKSNKSINDYNSYILDNKNENLFIFSNPLMNYCFLEFIFEEFFDDKYMLFLQ